MNKLIFQIGLLAFFVSIVLFGSNGANLVDMVSRSFIVFIIFTVGAICLLIVGSWVMVNGRRNASVLQQRRDQKETSNPKSKSVNSGSTK